MYDYDLYEYIFIAYINEKYIWNASNSNLDDVHAAWKCFTEKICAVVRFKTDKAPFWRGRIMVDKAFVHILNCNIPQRVIL